MTTNKDSKYFKNFDIALTGALLVAGYKLLDLDKSNPKKVQFIFASENGIDKAVHDYFSFNFPVDAQTYWNNIKMLKNRIYIN